MFRLGILFSMLALCSGIAGVGEASAEQRQTSWTVEFRYNAGRSAADNYSAFQRRARQACEMSGRRRIEVYKIEQKCTAELMDKLVAAIPSEFAEVHFNRTGRGATPATGLELARK